MHHSSASRPATSIPLANRSRPRGSFLLVILLFLSVLGSLRAQGPGSLDTGFAASTNSNVNSVAVQGDKVLLGGGFTQVNGVARSNVARLNLDGSLDAGFAPSADNTVVSMVVQPDGKVLLGGSFTQINGVAHNHIARLNANGSLDADFVASANGKVESVAVYANGKVLLGGRFTQVNGVARSNVARLNADGSLDGAFTAGTDSPFLGILGIAVQADGKVLLGGDFTQVNGVARNYVARLNADGTSDGSFGAGITGVYVASVTVQADGKVLLGGLFTQVNGVARNYVARLNANGSLDAGFAPNANNPVFSVALQGNGKLVLGGSFSQINGVARGNIARLNADGSLDAGFAPSADNTVDSVALQPDGKVLLGGRFTVVNGLTRNFVARLNGESGTTTPVLTSPTTASGQVGQPFTYQIVASNSPTSYGATGLSAGLSLNVSTGLISGVPAGAGSFTIVLTATNAAGVGSANLALTVVPARLLPPTITSPASAAGNINRPFSYQITADNSPTSFNATGLPAGLSVNAATGLISGTPAQAGTFNVTLSAANANGSGPAVTLTVTVAEAPPVGPVFFNGATDVGGGFSYLPSFGYFKLLPDNPGYVFHNDLGFLFYIDARDGKGGAYFYDFATTAGAKSLGFFYTSPSFPFPYLYSFELNAFLYYFPDTRRGAGFYLSAPRVFVRLDTGEFLFR